MASWWEAICLFFGLTVYLLILLVIILYVGLCWDEMNLRCFFATLFYFVWCFFFFLYDIMQLKRVTFMFIYSAGEVCAAVILLHEVHVCPSRHLISRLSPPASPQGEAILHRICDANVFMSIRATYINRRGCDKRAELGKHGWLWVCGVLHGTRKLEDRQVCRVLCI